MILGMVLIGLAVCGNLYLEKRKFSRTSSGGVEQFESYFAVWKSRVFEFGIKLVSGISLLAGIIIVIATLAEFNA